MAEENTQSVESTVREMRSENEQLKELVAELTLKNRILKKSLLGRGAKWDE